VSASTDQRGIMFDDVASCLASRMLSSSVCHRHSHPVFAISRTNDTRREDCFRESRVERVERASKCRLCGASRNRVLFNGNPNKIAITQMILHHIQITISE
jgi:hypothetical protein